MLINQLTDMAILKQIKEELDDKLSDKTVMTAIWKEANVDIRKGVTFEALMKEQN